LTLQANDQPFIIPLDRTDPAVEDGVATQRLYAWMQAISDRIPLEGSGSPEGSLTANKGRLYVNREGIQGERIYMKTTNGGNVGWQLA
jgi:hypothetical protein